MYYSDEAIIGKRKEQQQLKQKNISNGPVKIAKAELSFVQKQLFDGQMSILLPDNYGELPEQVARLKYPSDQRPQLIFSSEDTKVNFTFSLLNTRFVMSDIEMATKSYFGVMKRLHPGMLVYQKEINEAMGYFSFKMPGLDQDIFHLYAFTSINSKMLVFIFNCPNSVHDEWAPIVGQVMESIHESKSL